MVKILGVAEGPLFVGDKTITGTLQLGDGASTTPALRFISELALGIWRPGSSQISLGVSTSSRLAIDAGNGNFSLQWSGNEAISVVYSGAGSFLKLHGDAVLTRFAAGSFTIGGAGNGQLLGIKQLTELTTIAAAATTDTAILLPANAIILGVSVRVTVAIPTATNFSVGDAGSADRFSSAAVSVAANSTDKGTKAGAYYNASAAAVRITPDGTPAANTGRVRVTIHYIDITPPTS